MSTQQPTTPPRLRLPAMEAANGLDLRLTWDDIDRWATLLQNMDVAVIATDAAGSVKVWNHHAATLYGWTTDEAIGRPVQNLTVGPSDATVAGQIISSVTSGGMWEGEFVCVQRDGSTIDVHVIDAPIFGYRDGTERGGNRADIDPTNIVGIVGLSVDVSAGRDEIQRSLDGLRQASLRSLVEVDVERRRIALAVHDEIGQVLTALRSELQWMRERPDHERDEIIDRVTTLIDSGIDSVRRVCDDLRPRILHELGLEESIRIMARDSARRIGADVELEVDELPLLSPPAAIAMFRTAQECMTNIERHAASSASIGVVFRIGDSTVRAGRHVVLLQVTCDGGTYSGQQGYGISGMRNRLVAVGGTLVIESLADGGSRVTAEIGTDVAIAPDPDPNDEPIEYRGHEWHLAHNKGNA